MDRLNHVKIVTPDPAPVERFLTEVVGLPEGGPIDGMGSADQEGIAVASPARDDLGAFTVGALHELRRASGSGGLIVGSPESHQFQVRHGECPHRWAVAVGTGDIETAHGGRIGHGFPCTSVDEMRWGDGAVRYCFREVERIVFEALRAEARART